MTRRTRRRSEWHRTPQGLWTCSLGNRGYTVRLFEKAKDGMIYREVQRPNGRKDRRSIRTRDRDRARQLGNELLAGLLAGTAEPVSGPVRLGELCSRFVAECPMFLDNTERVREETTTKLQIIRALLGDACDVRRLTEDDVGQYQARRRLGGIRYGSDDDQITGTVRQRAVQADVKLLKQVLYWACSVTRPDGSRLLERNPLEYVRVKGEHDVRRPVASIERFDGTRKAMQAFQQRYAEESKTLPKRLDRDRAQRRHSTWLRAELALILLEATGRRRGSIMGLRWTDFDFAGQRITWSPLHDKKRKTWVVRYPASLFETVKDFQRRLGAVGGYCFPRSEDPTRNAPSELVSQWIRRAEDFAELPKLAGGTTHPYRRKWRSERRHHPTKAVAVAGGWTDVATMERCYDIPDDADLLAVTSEPHKRSDLAVVGGN